jgi:hypothetical protein
MNKAPRFLIGIMALALPAVAAAQSPVAPSSAGPFYAPNWYTGYTPTPLQWKYLLSNKMDYFSGGLPLQYGGTGVTSLPALQALLASSPAPGAFSSLSVSGNASIGGTLGVTGTVTAPTFSGSVAENGLGSALAPGSIVLASGGSGYAVGDVITTACSSATLSTAPTISVISVGTGGAITGSMVTNGGVASSVRSPSCTFTQAGTTGAGSGASWTGSWAPIAGALNSPSLSTGGSASNNGNLIIGAETPAAYLAGTENTFLGDRAGGTAGLASYNTFVGHNAGGIFGGANLAISSNTFIGNDSGRNIAGGNGNVGLGKDTLRNVAGSNNIAVGIGAGQYITSGGNNVVIGVLAGQTLVSGNQNLLLGADVPSASTSNYMSLGNVITSSGINAPSTSVTTVAGSLGVTGNFTAASITNNGLLTMANQTIASGSNTATMTNSPVSGNPTWIAVTINGAQHYLPVW